MQVSHRSPDACALKAFVGRTQSASAFITTELAERFRAALDLPGKELQDGDIAPLAIHFCLAPPFVATSALREDGHPAFSNFLPSPFPRRMWAGGALTYSGELRVGQLVTRHSEIADVALKTGRSGSLCFITVNHTFNAGGTTVLKERQDIVYREAHGGNPAPVSEPTRPTGTNSREIVPSPTLLFRYSALTFNSHRIHYDRTYCVEVEHYPGLVVHGPLQATLLLHYANELRGSPPRSFSFRSGMPLFDLELFRLNAREADGHLELWTSSNTGQPAMTASATW
ncbi:MAG: MaoC family dehydratase N-terminal domain-containing protein [Mesorhizobium sp.]